MLRVLVSSFGGVGSKCLVKGVMQTDDESILGQVHTHLRRPPDKRALDGRTMIYMFGDPYNAVISFFKRRMKKTRSHGFNTREGNGDLLWAVKHCQNIGGEYERMNPEWDVEAYLDNGEDLLKMEEHFDNWVNAKTDYPVLFVRYETMWNHLREICKFVGLPESAIGRFPGQEPRGSRWEDEPDTIKMKLAKMYGALHDKIAAAPDICVGSNEKHPFRFKWGIVRSS
jgi:hypothetical protein